MPIDYSEVHPNKNDLLEQQYHAYLIKCILNHPILTFSTMSLGKKLSSQSAG